MKNTPPASRRPGRPPTGHEAMTRFQLVIDRETIEKAEAEAENVGCSVSQVLRGWIDAGQRQKSPG